ncbi:54S ribosomal protein, mitochondrial [Arachnomyces sp. PD_36]|nr:54S ribosomal protein, mitochondrial [Arachnomyces sp. PD_36]
MPGNKALRALRWLASSSNGLQTAQAPRQCLASFASRSFATEAEIPTKAPSPPADIAVTSSPSDPSNIPTPTWNPQPAIATLYDFPSMEPLKFLEYSDKQLLLPLRRDILHRAVVYEGDATRQGTASTKWRGDVHGSGRKLAPQKGLGRARVGDKKSPIRTGGGVAFGPHPRDFSTDLPRKVYDLAWRTALSYRYRRGQLIIVNDNIAIPKGASAFLAQNIFLGNQWGKEHGRSLLITERKKERLFKAVSQIGKHGRVLDWEDVDVKDLLETGRIIIEKSALDNILSKHSADLRSRVAKA